jgi:hypothetical protein
LSSIIDDYHNTLELIALTSPLVKEHFAPTIFFFSFLIRR